MYVYTPLIYCLLEGYMLPIPPFKREPGNQKPETTIYWTKEEQELPGSCLNIGRDFEDEACRLRSAGISNVWKGFPFQIYPLVN